MSLLSTEKEAAKSSCYTPPKNYSLVEEENSCIDGLKETTDNISCCLYINKQENNRATTISPEAWASGISKNQAENIHEKNLIINDSKRPCFCSTHNQQEEKTSPLIYANEPDNNIKIERKIFFKKDFLNLFNSRVNENEINNISAQEFCPFSSNNNKTIKLNEAKIKPINNKQDSFINTLIKNVYLISIIIILILILIYGQQTLLVSAKSIEDQSINSIVGKNIKQTTKVPSLDLSTIITTTKPISIFIHKESISEINSFNTSKSLEPEDKDSLSIKQNKSFETTTSPELTTTTQEAQSQQATSAFEELLTKFKQVFTLKSNTETTTTTPLPTTTVEEEINNNNNQDESTTDNDDSDAEGCKGLSVDESAEAKNLTDVERLVNLQSCIQGKVKKRVKTMSRNSIEMFQKLSLSGACTNSLMNLMSSMLQIKSYAFKFVDASAKIPSGVMYGLLSDFGDFDQCLAIKTGPRHIEPEQEAEEGYFSGKYCLVSVKLNYHIKIDNDSMVPDGIQEDGILWDELIRNYWTKNSTKGFQVGVCVPSRCSNDDINQLYQQMASEYNFIGEIIQCQDSLDIKKQYKPDLLQNMIIYSFYTLIALTFIGTLVDRYYYLNQAGEQKSNNKSALRSCCCCFDLELLACFSIAKNWKTFVRRNDNKRWHKTSLSSSSSTITFNDMRTTRRSSTLSQQQSPSIDNQCENSSSATTLNINECIINNEQSKDKSLCQELTVKIDDNSQNNHSYNTILNTERTVGGNDFINNNSSSGSCLSHLSGLKLFVILWITSGHSFLYPSANNYQYYRSIININITRDSVWFAATNFTLGIDMLLYMTGLVFVYKFVHLGFIKSKKNTKESHLIELKSNTIEQGDNKINNVIADDDDNWFYGIGVIIRFMLKKILRFWPTYLSVIAIAIIVPLLSDGPMWPEMVSKRIGQSCRQNWWSNLLFINNFSLNESEICLPSSWFLSVLMQLFLIGSLIILSIRKFNSFKFGIILIFLLLIFSSSMTFMIVYLKQIQAPVIKMDETFVMEMDNNIFKMYTNLLNNLGPFLIGMLGGFLLIYEQRLINKRKICLSSRQKREEEYKKAKQDKNNLSVTNEINSIQSTTTSSSSLFMNQKSKIIHIFSGLLVILIGITVLSSIFHKKYTNLESALYWSFHRIGWAIVTGYIIHQCAMNRWKLLKDLLSLSSLIPLSRLIFIAYLIHPILIHIHSGLVRDGLHVSIYNMMTIYMTRLFMTFSIALMIHLFVELPFCSIEEILMQRMLIRRLNNNNNNNNDSEISDNMSKSKEANNNTRLQRLLIVAPVISINMNGDLIKKPTNKTKICDSFMEREDSRVQLVNSVQIGKDQELDVGSTSNGSNNEIGDIKKESEPEGLILRKV